MVTSRASILTPLVSAEILETLRALHACMSWHKNCPSQAQMSRTPVPYIAADAHLYGKVN